MPFCMNEQNTANIISKEISHASTDACSVDATAIVCDESESDFVTVSFGNGEVLATIDSGADLTIVQPECIPISVLQHARESGDVGNVPKLN